MRRQGWVGGGEIRRARRERERETALGPPKDKTRLPCDGIHPHICASDAKKSKQELRFTRLRLKGWKKDATTGRFSVRTRRNASRA